MRSRRFLALGLALLLGMVASPRLQAQMYQATVIDPGATSRIQCEAITPDGRVVGEFTRLNGQSVHQAFVWSGGQFTMLPGSSPTDAHAGNSSGATVGEYVAGSVSHGALWQNGS